MVALAYALQLLSPSRLIEFVLCTCETYQSLRASIPAPTQAKDIIFEYPLMEWEDIGGSKLKLKDVLLMAWGLCQVRWQYFWKKWPST